MRGANASEISSATMNHELVMRTSMPTIEPIRSVPGARGAAPRVAVGRRWIGGVGHTTTLANAARQRRPPSAPRRVAVVRLA